jgi:hypothetical protein
LLLSIDAVNNALLASELTARHSALQDFKQGGRPADWFLRGKVPAAPVKYQSCAEKWRWVWNHGFPLNYKRYYAWYEKGGMGSIHVRGEEVERQVLTTRGTVTEYDSGWLLYDPGEFKYLTHNLKLLPKDMVVDIRVLRGGCIVTAHCNPVKLTGVLSSELTRSTVKIHRLYKDEDSGAIRVRVSLRRK